MNVEEAFKILGLSYKSTEEEVNSRFRELAIEAHPDRGGKDRDMANLIAARNLVSKALRQRANNNLDVAGELSRINSEVSRRLEIKDNVKELETDIMDRRTKKMRTWGRVSFVTAVVSVISLLIGSGVIPSLVIPLSLISLLGVVAVVSSIVFILSNSMVREAAGDIEELFNLLHNKSFYTALFHEIGPWFRSDQPCEFGQWTGFMERWIKSKGREMGEIPLLAGKTGVEDFTRLMLYRGVELGSIYELEINGILAYGFVI